MAIVAPLLIGLAFGWLLQRAGLSRYDRIVNVFRFRDLAVLRFLLAALVVGAIGIQIVRAIGGGASVPVPATYWLGNFLGGAIFGVGMALSGFCPGTVAAGAGEGRLDYLVPGALGLYTGAVVYGLAYDRVMPSLARLGNLGPATIAALAGVPSWLVVALFAELAIVVFHLVDRPRG